jgi:hypothetical protein
MAAGLIDKVLSYEQYIKKVVLPSGGIEKRVMDKLREMAKDEWRKAAQKTKPKPEHHELWKAPPLEEKGVA